MYSACTFCNAPLGSNESVEHFPVGRRLAFDAGKGRLWVVCAHCRRWNLTPLEERWEAIDEAERLFRATRLRMSTENIGLARLGDGTDLVRVGRPQRPEMAAWRYGDQFARRRRRILLGSGATAVGLGAVAVSVPLAGFFTGVVAGAAGLGTFIAAIASMGPGTAVFRQRFVRDDAGQYLRVTPNEVGSVRLVGDAGGWAMRIPYASRRPTLAGEWTDWINKGSLGEATVRGDAAIAAARTLLPLVNGAGARPRVVTEAVGLLGEWGDASRGFADAASHVREWAMKQSFGDTGALPFLPAPVRLGLEMIAHEEQEQRALAGELDELERAWKDAEEIAGIADDMLLPGGVARSLAKLKAALRVG